jgi:predicted nucleotidyltransferase component of viral defense system
LFADIISIEAVDDGITFDQDSLVADEIKEDQQYEGIRVKVTALLGNARIHFQADVGFGDATVPPPIEVEYPTLLDFPPPRLRAYAKETVVAEKLEAIVDLAFTNSRMKDFYDLGRFAEHFEFDGRSLANAITRTFQRRQTSIPAETPIALTSEFFLDDDKKRQWSAFASKLQSEQSLEQVISAIADFVLPCLSAMRSSVEFNAVWRGGTWIHDT